MNRSTQIARLDTVFSQWVRLSKSNEDGFAKCISCGKIEYWQDMDNGHYIDRKHMSTRWDVDNCYPQCRSCNRYKDGYLEGYLEAIGDDMGQELTRRKYTIKRYDSYDLDALYEFYSKEVKQYNK